MRVLVCGGRDYCRGDIIDKVLSGLGKIDVIIEGGARGADNYAAVWAKMHGIENLRFHADWETYGRAAGHIRNTEMLAKGKPDLVVAFPGGRGTANMVAQAKYTGVEIMQVVTDG